jgi:hypothetical protein
MEGFLDEIEMTNNWKREAWTRWKVLADFA